MQLMSMDTTFEILLRQLTKVFPTKLVLVCNYNTCVIIIN